MRRGQGPSVLKVQIMEPMSYASYPVPRLRAREHSADRAEQVMLDSNTRVVPECHSQTVAATLLLEHPKQSFLAGTGNQKRRSSEGFLSPMF